MEETGARKRTMTAAGIDYQFNLLNENRDSANRSIRKTIEKITNLMESPVNHHLVRKEIENLDSESKEFHVLTERIKELKEQTNEEEGMYSDEHFILEVDQVIFNVKTEALAWLRSVVSQFEESSAKSTKSKKSSKGSKSSKSSGSSNGSKSSRKSIKDKLIEETAKVASLKAEASFDENLAQLKRDREIAKREAKMKVYENFVEEEETTDRYEILPSQTLHINQVPQLLTLNSDAKSFRPSTQLASNATVHTTTSLVDTNMNAERPLTAATYSTHSPEAPKPAENKQTLSSTVASLLRIQTAPDVTIDTFNGDSLEYKYFMTTFEDVIESKIDDARGRLTRLIQYTSGEAKDLVKGCIYLNPGDGYKKAKELLQNRFGDPLRVLAAYQRELREWKPIKSFDSVSLQKLYTFLVKTSNIATEHFNSYQVLCTVISKLPGNLRDRWNRSVYRYRTVEKREPVLADLIDFIERETVIATDPLFSKEAMNETLGLSNHQDSKKPKAVRTFLSNFRCLYCDKNHDLDKCFTFKALELKERGKWVLKNRLCFRCYRKGHIGRDCNKPRVCDTCKSKHPTLLHGYTPKARLPENEQPVKTFISSTSENVEHVDNYQNVDPVDNSQANQSLSVNVNVNKLTTDFVSMCLIPVYLKFTDCQIMTYALLDNCSQGTFIDENLVSRFDTKLEETQLSVNTINGTETSTSKIVVGLQVRGVKSESGSWIKLPKTYTRTNLPIDVREAPTAESLQQWPHLINIRDKLLSSDEIVCGMKVGILIGGNCPKAVEPLDVIQSQNNGPYAFQTRLGWCVVGPTSSIDESPYSSSCYRVSYELLSERSPNHVFVQQQQTKDDTIDQMLKTVYEANKENSHPSLGNEFSQDDVKFMKKMDDNCQKVSGHYVLPLPFRESDVTMPNNKGLAVKRLYCLKRKFIRDTKFHNDYTKFINDMLSKGFARRVDSSHYENDQWFIPHHGVYHPTKKKVRVVFDCSSQFKGKSLNQELLQGPDLTNQLVGVLTRFRQHPIATMGDIASMFYQVMIPESQRKYVKFLWWRDGNFSNDFEEYEMCAHLFGGTSSPSCANYALRRAATDGEEKYGHEAAETLRRNFYVDDMLKSTEMVSATIQLVHDVTNMCGDGGFQLTKFISNSKEVMESIPSGERRKETQQHDVLLNDLALGVQWNLQEDSLGLRIKAIEHPSTKRGLLSAIHKVYDPIGMVSPFLLDGKRILQNLCSQALGWDDLLPDEVKVKCHEIILGLSKLPEIKIPRCFHPADFQIKEASLHHFSDASDIGHGQCTYIRYEDFDSNFHCSFVIGKSRVNPLKPDTSMPRLELIAATLSAKIGKQIKGELDIPIRYETYWTDSKVVLAYINNDTKRFKSFVSNRISFIKKRTIPDQWRYVETNENPADVSTRGLNATEVRKVDMWLHGPEFLWKPFNLANQPTTDEIKDDDPEIKKTNSKFCAATAVPNENYFLSVIGRFSSWWKMVRVTAFVLRFITNCQSSQRHRMKLRSTTDDTHVLTVDELEKASRTIFKQVQQSFFATTITQLQNGEEIKKNDRLIKLNPYIHSDDLLRVGGRLQRSTLDYSLKHPIILPKQSTVTEAVVRFHHQSTFHSGRGITINQIRDNGLWIVNINSAVRHVLHHCVICRYLRGKVNQQRMGDLPSDRVESTPPFTHTGVDLFGPFFIKVRRSFVKRYGVMFTCLSCRAVHLESVNSLETDSFIMALRRFVSRRGDVRMIRSDNGTNFVGADKQLHREFMEMDHSKIANFLSKHKGDWIVWKRNPPSASNFGGVWERQIQTARSILSAMMKTHGESLNDESFRTVLVEIENVINSRPLSVEVLSDPSSLKPISPMTLLTQKSKVVYPLPGKFESSDVYSRKHWRRVQHLVNEFWDRWRKEYLSSLQVRQKWYSQSNNLSLDDVVILKEESKPRNEWQLGRVTKLFPDGNGVVRSVEIELANKSRFTRPVNKLILIQKC